VRRSITEFIGPLVSGFLVSAGPYENHFGFFVVLLKIKVKIVYYGKGMLFLCIKKEKRKRLDPILYHILKGKKRRRKREESL